MKVLSLLPVLGHPRDSKRISMLMNSGFSVKALAFERDYHSGRFPECPYESLGKISHGDYFKRFIKIITVIPRIRKAIKVSDAVFTSGPDMAFLALIASVGLKTPVVLEVGDIRDIQLDKGISGKIVRYFDKLLVDSCELLVVISQGFKSDYYEGRIKTKTPILLIENKLEFVEENERNNITKYYSLNNETRKDNVLKIGYFGLLRDEWSLKVLENIAMKRPSQIEIILAGYPSHPIENLEERIAGYKNIKYLGQYKSPADLPVLYNQIDMVWACYPPIGENDWNFKWGRPNRFFESCFFKKPLFIRGGCHCANDIKYFDIGNIINETDVEITANKIVSIEADEIEVWKRNMEKLPLNLFMYTTEEEELKNCMIRMINKYKC
jgi:succinoglycan biosynthesis protein ExoL